jgi:hypothetical protein
MFSLSYTIEYAIDERYPMSPPSKGTCLGVICPTEEYANEMLDLLAKRGTILETTLTYLPNYKPRKSVVYATTRSWE